MTGWRMEFARAFRAADRPVEERNAVPAFQVGGVGQHQVGVGDRLGEECVGVDDVRNAIAAGTGPCRPVMRDASPGFIDEFHAMLAMYMNSVSIWYGSPAWALAITVCISPCADIGASQVNALSMRTGVAVVLQQQVLGAARIAQRHAGQHGVRLCAFADGLRTGRDRPGERRLVAPGARRIDGTQQHLQHVNGAAGVEPVGMRGDAAHRVHRHRAAEHRLVPPAGCVGPGLIELDRLVEGDVRQLARRCGGWSPPGCRTCPPPPPARSGHPGSVPPAGGRRGRRDGRRAG